jgi:DNA-binding NtrC family response regulator
VRKRSIALQFYPKNLRTSGTRTQACRAKSQGELLAPLVRDRRTSVTLLADRFIIVTDDRAVDLASGNDVVCVTGTAGGASAQAQWTERCDWWFRLAHPAIAPFVDYGLFGEMRRFEAWDNGSPWRGSREEAAHVRDRVARFLRANGRSEGSPAEVSVRQSRGRAVVMPAADAGYPLNSPQHDAGLNLACCGVQVIDRAPVSALTELLTEEGGQRAVAIVAASGFGTTTTIRSLARAARLNGYVPLSVGVEPLPILDLVRERSLFLIADRLGSARVWRGFLEWTLRIPKPHILVMAHAGEPSGMPIVRLDRLTPEALMQSVVPSDLPPALRRRIERAAQRSGGVPGRFTSILWGQPLPNRLGPAPAKVSLVAEKPAVYGEEEPEVPDPRPPMNSPPWPAPGELGVLKRQMARAVAQLVEGRHVPGERALRSATAGFARRRAWNDAAAGTRALASALIRRGRSRDAQRALAEATEYGQRAGHDDSTPEVALLSGTVWTDLGRLDEAERILGALLSATTAAGDPRQVTARLALARCLFWRGRYDDAHRALAAIEGDQLVPALAVQTAVARSRVAIGRHDLESGVAQAGHAVEAAERTHDPSLVAHAACGLAFAHLATGDRAAVARDAIACIRAARAAREPLRALRARLIAAESGRRAGRPADAAALVGRIGKLPSASLPVTVRARSALLADLLSAQSTADAVKRHVAATGLGALALFAPHGADHAHTLHIASGDVVDILRLCQSSDEDAQVLTKVCALLRGRLRAAAVAFLVAERGTLVPLAGDGSNRLNSDIAARAIAAGQQIAPHTCRHDVEAAVPIRCGGDTQGALVIRWPIGAAPDRGRTAVLLTTAAVAAGPVVASALARRTERQYRHAGELLGASAAMEQVRRSVERAAAAPFAVLVEGESGSGKELVARALHRRSPRRERAFCTVNCAALPDDLVEAELFGHARGAFTGAVSDRPGVFEEAHTGTLFLDEVGELSLRAQAKLLRTIQDGELRRVGENVPRRVDVRIVSATNRDLRMEVGSGRFRHDLLYRLDVVRIAIPPLRERRDDIAILVERFWRDAIERVGSRAVLSTAVVAALARYDWPGNVRELQNVLAALAVRSPKRGVLAPEALPPVFGAAGPDQTWRLEDARRTFEQHFVRAALVRTGGHRTRAAEELGVTRQGLTKLLTRLGIS